jgi:predicted HTH domain antitoxin
MKSKKPNKLSIEQELEVIKIYQEQTISAENVGKMYGVSERPILAILKRHNIHRKNTYEHMGHKFSKEDINIIIDDYKNGITQKVIGDRYGVCRKVIRKLLTKNGIKVRNTQDNRIIKKEYIPEIVRLYVEEGWSSGKIAKMYKVTHGSILPILWENNVKMRLSGEGGKLFNREEELKICKIYTSKNISLLELGELFGCTQGPIKRVLVSYGIVIRYLSSSIYRYNGGWGISGFYNGYHFRSINELSFIINYLEKKNIKFKSGESNLGIKYYHSGMHKIRRYYPDFITDKYMFENKPKCFWHTIENVEKSNSAKEYCKLHNLIYQFVDYPVILSPILERYFSGQISFSKKSLEKFRRIYKKYLV